MVCAVAMMTCLHPMPPIASRALLADDDLRPKPMEIDKPRLFRNRFLRFAFAPRLFPVETENRVSFDVKFRLK